jgi:HD-GYP domain-containing protein (c-di-GMP phosphodiesterase class II)
VCDVFDALVSTRVYRSAWTTEQALAFLAERAGTEFDERCVTALRDVVAGEQAPVGPEDRRRLLPHPAERFLTPTAGGRVRVV